MTVTADGAQLALLAVMGLEWPGADEDAVSAYAGRLTRFATDLDTAQQGAASAVAALGQSYQAASYTALSETAARAGACTTNVVATAGQVANAVAGVAATVAQTKLAVLQLLTEAAVAAGVSSVNPATALTGAATQIVLGYRAAVEVALVKGLRAVVDTGTRAAAAMEQALGPEAVGQVFNPTAGATGGMAQGAAQGGRTDGGYRVDVSQLAVCAKRLRSCADEMGGHGSAFGSTTADLVVGAGTMAAAVEAARQRITQAVVGGTPGIAAVYVRIAERIEQTAANYQAAESQHAEEMNSTSW